MTWKDCNEEPLPEDRLVLVDFGDFYPKGFRSRALSGDLYDEHGNLDDSGIEPKRWRELPE